jgi:hypothetical protein
MKHAILLPTILLLASVAVVSSADRGADERKIRVLIVDGFSNHDWSQTTALLRGILARNSLFQVAVSTAPGNTDDTAWGAWRPIILRAVRRIRCRCSPMPVIPNRGWDGCGRWNGR